MEEYKDNKYLLSIVEKKKNENNNFLRNIDNFLNLNRQRLKLYDAIKYNIPFPLRECNENIMILNNKQKCNICNNISYFKINTKTLCWNHFLNIQDIKK